MKSLLCVERTSTPFEAYATKKKVPENFDFADGFMRARAGFKVEQTFVTVFGWGFEAVHK